MTAQFTLSEIAKGIYRAEGMTDPEEYNRILNKVRELTRKGLVEPVAEVGQGQTAQYSFVQAVKLALLSYLAEVRFTPDDVARIAKEIDPSRNNNLARPLSEIVPETRDQDIVLDLAVRRNKGALSYTACYRLMDEPSPLIPEGMIAAAGVRGAIFKEIRTIEISGMVRRLADAMGLV